MSSSLKCRILLIFFTTFPIVQADLPIEMVRDFFRVKKIGAIFLRPCNQGDSLRAIRFLNIENNISTKALRFVKDMEDESLFDTPGRIGVYLDLTCTENQRFFIDAATIELNSLRWVWLLDIGTDDFAKHFLATAEVGFINDMTYAVKSGNASAPEYLLYNAYTRPWLTTDRLVQNRIGTWSGAGALVYQATQREYSLDGSVLKGGFFVTQNIYDDKNLYAQLQNKTYMPSLDTANRFYYAVSLHIADLHNYTLELLRAETWGYLYPNGTWDGMLGMLSRGTADLTMSPMRLGSERLEIADPLFPIQQFTFPFIFKQPKRTGTYKALALQFQMDAWLSTGFMVVVSSLCLSLIQWLRNRQQYYRDVPESEAKEGSSVPYNAVLVIGSICLQGLAYEPPDLARRIACFWILFCCLMISTYYNAATMNALLSPSPPGIRSLRELLDSNIPLALNDAAYFTKPKARATILDQPTMDRIDHYALGFLTLEQGLQLILKGGAFCGEDFTLFKGIGATFKDEQKCDLSIIRVTSPQLACYFIPKKSPYKEMLFQGTLRVKEHGLVDRQYRYWYPAKPECLVNQEWLWVGLEAVSMAIAIFVFGFFMSSVIFIFEILSNFPKKLSFKVFNMKPR